MAKEAILVIMNWIWRLVWLNILWILFSIPIITIIPSTFAMIGVSNKWFTENVDIDISPTFLSIFKKYFLKSYYLGIVIVVIGSFLSFDFMILSNQTEGVLLVLKYSILILAILFIGIASYSISVFTLQTLPWYKAIGFSFFITIRQPILTVLMLCGIMLCLVVALFFTGIGILFVGSLSSLFISVSTISGIKKLNLQ